MYIRRAEVGRCPRTDAAALLYLYADQIDGGMFNRRAELAAQPTRLGRETAGGGTPLLTSDGQSAKLLAIPVF